MSPIPGVLYRNLSSSLSSYRNSANQEAFWAVMKLIWFPETQSY